MALVGEALAGFLILAVGGLFIWGILSLAYPKGKLPFFLGVGTMVLMVASQNVVTLTGVASTIDGAPRPRVAAAKKGPVVAGDIPAKSVRGQPWVASMPVYVKASNTCPKLTWNLLAGVGKIETNHGRSSAPGIRSGVNRFGCCAGPMQFNRENGPPSTWDEYRRPGDSVYHASDAVPAAARKLCRDGLAGLPGGPDPCPGVAGTAAMHRAVKRYNNACWYVRKVIKQSEAYRTAARGRA